MGDQAECGADEPGREHSENGKAASKSRDQDAAGWEQLPAGDREHQHDQRRDDAGLQDAGLGHPNFFLVKRHCRGDDGAIGSGREGAASPDRARFGVSGDNVSGLRIRCRIGNGLIRWSRRRVRFTH